MERIDWQERVADLKERSDKARAERIDRNVGGGGVPVEGATTLEEAHERAWAKEIPLRYREARLSDLEGDMAHVKEWDGKSDVLLLGNVGAGKTHAAVALAREAHDQHLGVLFRPALALLESLKPGGDERAMDRATSCDLLILDDLGTQRQTDFSADRISLVLVTRYDNCLPTVVTSNLAPSDLERQVGERLWSRLFEESLRVKTAGADRRRVA